MAKKGDGRLHIVETSAGRRRVSSTEITRFLGELNIMRKEVM